MFVAHDRSSNKKRFQKPNILRKNSKFPITKPGVSESIQSHPDKSLVSTTHLSQNENYEAGTITKSSYCKPYNSIRKLPQIIKLNENNSEKNEIKTSFKTNINHANKLQFNNGEDNNLNCMNFDTFLNSDLSFESSLTFNIHVSSKDSENESEQKSTHDFVTNCQKNCYENNVFEIENIYIDKHETVNNMVPLSNVVSCSPSLLHSVDKQNAKVTQLQDSYVENGTNDNDAVKIKCNVPYCNEEFNNDKSIIKRSMNVHNKSGSSKASRQTVFECPVKTSDTNEGVESCSRIFLVKEELVKHLNEDHTLEQAPHKCEECGRGFFWAAGLRAHKRAHVRAAVAAARGAGAGAGASLACAWPGCGRVFRQPCRLREHTRAHTGDRPYPCPYPNCGWSFRTASKLERHARRHTGERRHACAACGRAFRRREHLRDHAARCHPPLAPHEPHSPLAPHAPHSPLAPHAPHTPRATQSPRARRHLACRHADCPQKFTSGTSLSMHMKEVHQSDEGDTTVADRRDVFVEQIDIQNLSSLGVESAPPKLSAGMTEAAAGEGACGGAGGGAEWHAARTHCTWPLPARAVLAYDDSAYVLEEEAAIEQSEGSESNVFTVRSDLFLHAGYDEDSRSMQSVEQQGEGGVGGGGGGTADGVVDGDAGDAGRDDGELVLLPPAPLDADLGLHSTIDLMQEQLLYTNPAVDETYRVYLLNED